MHSLECIHKQKKTGLQMNMAVTGEMIDDAGQDDQGIRREVGIPENWGQDYTVHVTGGKKWLPKSEEREFRCVFLSKVNLHHKYDVFFSFWRGETLTTAKRIQMSAFK